MGTFGKGIVGDSWQADYFVAIKITWVQAVLFVYRNVAFG